MPNRMREGGLPPELADIAAEWRTRLRHTPSVFGRLVYLVSLREPHTGLYRDPELSGALGRDGAHRLLGSLHREAFREWLGFTLEEQQADLELYLSDLTADRLGLVRTWLRLGSYRNLVPGDGEDDDVSLFEVDVSALLQLLSRKWAADTGVE